MTPNIPDVKEVITIEQFEQDLHELAGAYNAAFEAGNETEKGVIFEIILELGSEQILSMTGDPTAKDKIRAVIERLDIRGPKETLYLHMLGHGYNQAVKQLIALPNREPGTEELQFDSTAFQEDFLIMIAGTRAIRTILDMGNLKKEGDKEALRKTSDLSYQKMVEKVATLPRSLLIKALSIAEQCFATTEQPLATGPRALQAAGKRSFITFSRDVGKHLMIMKTNPEPLETTDQPKP